MTFQVENVNVINFEQTGDVCIFAFSRSIAGRHHSMGSLAGTRVDVIKLTKELLQITHHTTKLLIQLTFSVVNKY